MTLSPALAELLNHARATAKRSGHSRTEPIHLLAALIRDEPDLCARFIDEKTSAVVSDTLASLPRSAEQTIDAERTLELLSIVGDLDSLMPSLVAEIAPILQAATDEGTAASQKVAEEPSAPVAAVDSAPGEDPSIPVALADLLVLEDDGRELVARGRILSTLIEALSRDSASIPLLVGEPGVGRTSIIDALRREVAAPEFRGPLRGAKVFRLRAERVVGAGRADALRRVLSWLYLQRADGGPPTVLCVDDLEVLAALGGSGADLSMLGLIRSLVDDGRLAIVLTIASGYVGRLELHDGELVEELERVDVPSPTDSELREIATIELRRLEGVHGVTCDASLLDAALAPPREGTLRVHPGLAVHRLDRACARAALRGDSTVVADDFVEASVEQGSAAGVVVNRDELIEKLSSHIVAQDAAIEQLVSRLVMTRRGLDLAPERPDGVFLFAGPTGVGKTALARALSEELFGSSESLITIDMSEYVHDWAVSRLIGPQPGYVGSTEPEQWLTTRVRAKPNCVLLLDEIEKAHPLVWNVFLQVFDAGRLTDSRGQVASFSDVIVIMTSNLGAHVHDEKAQLGFGVPGETAAAKDDAVKDAIRSALSPELINRLDAILVFRLLSPDAILSIARKTITEALANLGRLGFDVAVEDSVIELVAAEGFDRRYGARHLRRTIEQMLLEPLVADNAPGRYVARAADAGVAWVAA